MTPRPSQTVALACGVLLLLASASASGQSSVDAAIEQAKRKLENVQRNTYAILGRTPKSYSKTELDLLDREADERLVASLAQFPQTTQADIARIMAKIAEARKDLGNLGLPTKYENPVLYRTIQTVVLQIFKGTEEFRKSHPDVPVLLPDLRQIVIGTKPGDSPNASVGPVNPDEKDKSRRVYGITIDTGLLRFAEVFSDIIIRLASPAEPRGRLLGLDLNPEEVRARLDRQPEITREFHNVISAYLLHGGAFLALDFQSRESEEPYATSAAMMYRWILVFSMAHELGHVIYDQYNLYETEDSELPAGWSEEFFADGWAMALSLMAMGRNMNIEFAILGAGLYFDFYDLVERGVSLVTTGQDVFRANSTHPPAYRRKEKIPRYTLTALRRFWGKEPASIRDFDQIVRSSRLIDSAIDVLWERAKPGMLELYRKNAQLAPGWKPLIPAQAR